MTVVERHIVEAYSHLFEKLSSNGKLELLERLKKSLEKERKIKEKDFFDTFGAFKSDLSAEELAKEIRESRKFRRRELKF